MNNKENAVKQIEEFLKSDEKCLLITGTHQYNKHKIIMSVLNKHLNNNLILFRTNSMENIENEDFLGWAGVKKRLKAGERVKIGKNTYECDSLNTVATWNKTSNDFSCAIVYPLDQITRSKKIDAIEDLFKLKRVSKVFLVSWTDQNEFDYTIYDKYISRHIVYDAEEEEPEYHQRVLDIVNGKN